MTNPRKLITQATWVFLINAKNVTARYTIADVPLFGKKHIFACGFSWLHLIQLYSGHLTCQPPCKGAACICLVWAGSVQKLPVLAQGLLKGRAFNRVHPREQWSRIHRSFWSCKSQPRWRQCKILLFSTYCIVPRFSSTNCRSAKYQPDSGWNLLMVEVICVSFTVRETWIRKLLALL